MNATRLQTLKLALLPGSLLLFCGIMSTLLFVDIDVTKQAADMQHNAVQPMTETIVVVPDEQAMRRMLAEMLDALSAPHHQDNLRTADIRRYRPFETGPSHPRVIEI